MAVVWDRTPVAASTVVEVLEDRKQWTLATVRTLLRRLVNKGALQQEAEGKRYIYTPLISMAECVRRESESLPGPGPGPRPLGSHSAPGQTGGVVKRGHPGIAADSARKGEMNMSQLNIWRESYFKISCKLPGRRRCWPG